MAFTLLFTWNCNPFSFKNFVFLFFFFSLLPLVLELLTGYDYDELKRERKGETLAPFLCCFLMEMRVISLLFLSLEVFM